MIARLLYLTSEWQSVLDEAGRTLARNGCVLHEWGNGDSGEEWVQIRDEARRLFESTGIASPFHPGVRSEAAMEHYLSDIGLVRESVVSFGPGPETTLREFVRRIVSGEFSYVWSVPESARATCLPELERWTEQAFDIDRVVAIPREIRWTVYRAGQP